MARTAFPARVALCLLSLSACFPGASSVLCGAGTVLMNGVCVVPDGGSAIGGGSAAGGTGGGAGGGAFGGGANTGGQGGGSSSGGSGGGVPAGGGLGGGGTGGDAGGGSAGGGAAGGGTGACNRSNCQGCCLGDVCEGGSTPAACGSGGNVCVQCKQAYICVDAKCVESEKPESKWLLVPVSAKVAPNNNGRDWDPLSAPDPEASMWCPSATLHRTLHAPARSDTYMPEWPTVEGGCFMSKEDLQTVGFSFKTDDLDALGTTETISPKTVVKPSDADFARKFIIITNLQSLERITFKLDKQ